MARKTHPQPKHYGISNDCTRIGKRVCVKPETKTKEKDEDGNETVLVHPAQFRDFDSISQAKRFMRVGYR